MYLADAGSWRGSLIIGALYLLSMIYSVTNAVIYDNGFVQHLLKMQGFTPFIVTSFNKRWMRRIVGLFYLSSWPNHQQVVKDVIYYNLNEYS